MIECDTGPGCSSVGGGMLSELGPFYPTPDGAHLLKNPYSWNKGRNRIPFRLTANVFVIIMGSVASVFGLGALTGQGTQFSSTNMRCSVCGHWG